MPALVRLHGFGVRARQVGLLATVTGALTGLAVAGFDRAVQAGIFERVLDAPLWVQAVAPGIGLALAAAALRWVASGAGPALADEYVKEFHTPDHRLDLRPVPGRVLAAAATLGGGAAMGFEGPSIYMGAAIGSLLQRRFKGLFSRADAKVLLVCGAAAGVAAVFKAPATGMVFALEVPYRQDLARRMLLPAMFSAAASYVVFAAINGTTPLLPIGGTPPFDLRDLGGAAVIGLAGGLGARLFTSGLHLAKQLAARVAAPVRVSSAGIALAGAFAAGRALTGESLVIGSGYRAIDWSLDPTHAVGLVLAVFALRAVATTLAVGAGGVGGLFVPLVTQGAILGSAAGAAVDAPDPTLFPLLGVAAFLGAGYRVPLAAVVFVAETTGKPGFVVPGLIAAATSQLLIGRASASALQRDTRTGLLERRLELPVTAALRTDAATVPPDATLTEFFDQHVVALRLRAVPIVDGATYLGMARLDDLGVVPRRDWDTTTVDAIADREGPAGDVRWTLGHAVVAMEQADTDRLPILDDGAFVGMTTTGEILKLETILEHAGPAHDGRDERP